MEESTGKPTMIPKRFTHENENETHHEARNNTENTQEKLQAVAGKFDDALWLCHPSLMCDLILTFSHSC